MAVSIACVPPFPHLRNLESLQVVLEEAAAILVGAEGSFDITESLSSNCPMDRTVASWQIKMDQVAMLYDRYLMQDDFEADRHLCLDQSPVHKLHVLCIREEVFYMSRHQYDSGGLPCNFKFCSRRLPPTLTSLGNASFIQVGLKLVHSILLI